MGRQVFVLKKTKPFRYGLKLFCRDGENKIYQTIAMFTTEHLVTDQERVRNARKKAAEYIVSDDTEKGKREIDALYRDTGYGITFHHKDDPEGKRKKDHFNVTPLNAKKTALKNLFEIANLEFDGEKPLGVLQEEYNIHMSATMGKTISKGAATQIPHTPVDIQQNMQDQVAEARKKYKEEFGEEIPAEFSNDLAFLDGLSVPGFDAKAYIKEHSTTEELDAEEGSVENKTELPSDPIKCQELYHETFGKHVAPPKKNDVAWMHQKIAEELSKED